MGLSTLFERKMPDAVECLSSAGCDEVFRSEVEGIRGDRNGLLHRPEERWIERFEGISRTPRMRPTCRRCTARATGQRTLRGSDRQGHAVDRSGHGWQVPGSAPAVGGLLPVRPHSATRTPDFRSPSTGSEIGADHVLGVAAPLVEPEEGGGSRSMGFSPVPNTKAMPRGDPSGFFLSTWPCSAKAAGSKRRKPFRPRKNRPILMVGRRGVKPNRGPDGRG
jgi:hypothetical protein